MTNRTLLRRSRTPFGSDATFLTGDAIEVDSTQNYEIVRRRVLFDDVHLVTLHHERGAAFVIVTGLFAVFFLSIAILLLSIDTDSWPAALPFLAVGLLFLFAFAIRVAMGRDVITVFGRRSKAVLRFGAFSGQRPREVYGQICAAVRRGQSAVVETPSASAPELPPDFLPPTVQ